VGLRAPLASPTFLPPTEIQAIQSWRRYD